MMSLRTYIMHVEDLPGVLNRVTSLFRRRGYNIESLTVGRTENAGVSRMTIVMEADDDAARRIEANLYKLVNVLKVEDTTRRPCVTRELALIKVRTSNQSQRAHVMRDEVLRALGDPAQVTDTQLIAVAQCRCDHETCGIAEGLCSGR